MPQNVTKTYTLYQFDELSEEAKEKARNWYRRVCIYDGELSFEYTKEDAKNIGLRIVELQTCRSSTNQGDFIGTAEDCAEKIIKEHGETCETYKTASAFIKDLKELEKNNSEKENDNQETIEEIEKEFMRNLLEDYRIMYEKEIEYQSSDEVVDEAIKANEYTFTEDGKRSN